MNVNKKPLPAMGVISRRSKIRNVIARKIEKNITKVSDKQQD